MPTTATTLGSGGIALLVLTLICWLLMLVYLFGVAGQEAHGDAVVGQAFSWLAAMLLAGLVWLWLGGLLLKAGTQGMMPGWANGAATILYLMSGAAAGVVFFLIQDPKRVWPLGILALLPPTLAFYVFALYQPSLRPFFSGTNGSVAAGIVVLILSIAPWPALVQKVTRDRIRRIEDAKATAQWNVEEQARKHATNLEKLHAMTPDAPLMNWYDLLEPDSGVRTEALEALRHVERRQADIEDMLSYGVMKAMMLLPELDLQPTPQLCAAARTFLLQRAKGSRIRPKQDPAPYTAGGYVEDSLPGIRWLLAHGCDCNEGIVAMEASVETYLDSPDRKKALASLAELHQRP
jgi:hypothetical protein